MGDSSGVTLAAARLLANVINPLFVILLFVCPFQKRRRQSQPADSRLSARFFGKWVVFCVLGVALPVAAAEYSKHHQLWNGHSGFPSGHETFAASAATCLVLGESRWMPVAIVLVGAMGWALVRAGYHDTSDVIGALVLGPSAAGLLALLLGIRGRRAAD